MRNLAVAGALFALKSSADPIELCTQVMKADANPIYSDYCMERCSLWGSDYGVAFCGADVKTDGTALVKCVYKMESGCVNTAKPTNSPTSAPTPPPTLAPSTTGTTECPDDDDTEAPTPAPTTTTRPTTTPTTRPITSPTTAPTSAPTPRPTPAPTEATTPRPTTAPTTASTSAPTPRPTPAPTSAPTPRPTPSPTAAPTTTTAAGPKPEHEIGAPGMWFPNDAPLDSPSGGASSIVGPNGECILSYDPNREGYAGGSYVGVGSKVYKAKWYASPAEKPGNGDPWEYVQDCVGSAPAVWSPDELINLVKNSDEATIFYAPWSPDFPSVNEAKAVEQAVAASDPKISMLRDAFRVLTREEIEKITPGASTNPENVKRVESFLKPKDWFKFFPLHHESYSYQNFIRAVGAFPEYCKTYSDGRDSDKICKKLVAASFAHYAQETGANAVAWTLDRNDAPASNTHEEAREFYGGNEPIPLHFQGLYFVREVAFNGPGGESATTSTYEACNPYSDLPWAEFYPCSKKHTYFGRGSKQLSWNYNYGMFSEDMFGDALELLEDPAQVADTWLNFASGIWFAVTPQVPKPSMVWSLDGTWEKNDIDAANGLVPGFGATIMIINGGYECGKDSPAAANRERCYKALMEAFGQTIPADEPTNCKNMKPFSSNSPGALPMYWNKDWATQGCKVGTVQTPFRISREGDYQKCVDWYWRSYVVYQNKVIGQFGEKVN